MHTNKKRLDVKRDKERADVKLGCSKKRQNFLTNLILREASIYNYRRTLNTSFFVSFIYLAFIWSVLPVFMRQLTVPKNVLLEICSIGSVESVV